MHTRTHPKWMLVRRERELCRYTSTHRLWENVSFLQAFPWLSKHADIHALSCPGALCEPRQLDIHAAWAQNMIGMGAIWSAERGIFWRVGERRLNWLDGNLTHNLRTKGITDFVSVPQPPTSRQ